MSNHAVEVIPVTLLPHPNADSLSIVRCLGWQAIVRTADWEGRTVGAYIPPDSVLPDGFMPDLPRRVRAVRLRGEVSEGLLVPAPEGSKLGDDVAALLGVTHYEPAPETVSGDDAPRPEGYVPVYDVENARRYSRWTPGEMLVVTEKLHGENWRATYRDGAVHVSSRTRWKMRVDGEGRTSHFWLTANENVQSFLKDYEGVVLFGESYGGVGGFPYDAPKGNRALRVFDVWSGATGGWWAWNVLREIMAEYGIPTVPELARVPYDGLDALASHAEGPSTLNGSHIREGVVVRPLIEERPTASPSDRAVLKIIGRGYLTKKEK